MLYKPRITQNDAKQHLHDIRCQRQKQLTLIIDECHQLRIKHKHIFDCQFNSYSNEKSFLIKNEVINQQNDFPIVNEFTEYLSESSSIFFDNQISNHRILSPRKKTQQRCLSVSSVASIDKRANKIYEQWPDYPHISQIVGYRIEKIPPIKTPPQPVIEINQKKRKKSTRFSNAAKQIQDMSSIERDALTSKSIEEPPVVQPIPIINTAPKEIKPTLPSILCPSSKMYSKRIQTRQWLIKHSFLPQTLPLV